MSRSIIVAVETATDGCSVAVDTLQGVFQRFERAPRQHSVRLLPMLERTMSEAGVSRQQVAAVAFGKGPGSFVGVRLAASVAQGLCAAWEVPALPVSTLEALASGACREYSVQNVVVALDARMGQVYCGLYRLTEERLMEALGDGDQLADPERLAAQLGSLESRAWFMAGSAFTAYAEHLPEPLAGCLADALPQARDLLPRARYLFDTAQGVRPEQALPVYLREGV